MSDQRNLIIAIVLSVGDHLGVPVLLRDAASMREAQLRQAAQQAEQRRRQATATPGAPGRRRARPVRRAARRR